MPWLQLRIPAPPEQVPRIEKALSSVGARAITLEDNADQPIFEPALGETPLWHETRLTGLFSADIDSNKVSNEICRQAKLEKPLLHWSILEDKDWEREWMQHYTPIQCGKNFWICPSWTEVPDPDAVNLMLDPGLAFGTGTHPTTFLCLEWLAKQDIAGTSVIDYGCGSGILGIAALLLGADSATGVDVDPQALVATRQNIERNGLDLTQFPVFFPSNAPNTRADLVLANILAGPLVELAPALIALLAPNAKLCLSGILVSQKDAVINAYTGAIDFDDPTEKGDWLRITGIKRKH